MTDREAEAVALVLCAADGWCSLCAAMLLQRIERKLPDVNWRRVLWRCAHRALVEIEHAEEEAVRGVLVHDGARAKRESLVRRIDAELDRMPSGS